MTAPTSADPHHSMSLGPVLVVHADPQFAERVVRALSGHGLRAESVSDGERAIDRFVQVPACALVVDSELPGRDGAATIESIRWAPGGALVPVVLTAERAGGVKLSETGKRLGAATLEGAAARDPEVVARLVWRALGQPAPAQPPRDVRTAPAIEVSHSSLTLSARSIDALDAVADDDSLPPVSAEGAARVLRERQTVAVRMRTTGPATADHEPVRPEPVGVERPRRAEESSPFVLGDDPGAEQEGNDVERRAADLTPGGATQAGRFSELPFPRVLARLAAQRATGALVVVAQDDERLRTTTGESPKKVVYFRNGVPVYVKSNLVRECLGQILVQGDVITPQMRNESVQRMRAGEGRQGAILLAMGVLAPQELRDGLEEQLRVKLYDLFSWEDAEFRFSSRVQPPPEVVTLELGLTEIVFEGVVRRIPPTRLLELLEPHLSSFVVPITERLTRFVRLDLVAEARLVLRVVDGTQRLRDLLTVAGQRPGAAAQLLYAMECLGALRFSDLPIPLEAPEPDAAAQDLEDETLRGPIPALALAALRVPAPPPSASPAPEANEPMGWDDLTSDENSIVGTWDVDARPPIAVAAVARQLQVDRVGTADTVHAAVSPTPAPSAPTLTDDASMVTMSGAALDVRVERIAEAERHFRRGERALARGRHDDAVAAFVRAVELVPDEGEFLARLAHTRLMGAGGDPTVHAAQLAELERAASLAPKHFLTHLLLAEARRLIGDTRGARDAYENALAADPECREALEGLRGL